jgi:class 3 adenylate cyclase
MYISFMRRAESLSVSDLTALVETGRQLASEINLRVLLDGILDVAARLTDSPDGAVLLYDPHRAGLFFAAAIGESAPKLLEEWGESSAKRVPLTGSKAGYVFQTGETVIDDSLEADSSHYKRVDSSTSQTTRSMLCVPLSVVEAASGQRTPLGAIQILNRRAGSYTARDRLLLENFGSQAAVAIRNATLFRDLLASRGLYARSDPFKLVERLDREPALERLTIMFPDMRGYTQLLQSMNNALDLHTLMSQFLTMLAEETLRFGGVVNKALGDGILAFFSGGDAPTRAVACAFAIVSRFEHIRRAWDDTYSQDLQFLDIGIGIASGDVIVGAFGTGDMRDFTVMGVPVNLAAAFQAHARNGKRILVDQQTFVGARGLIAEAVEQESFKLHKPGQDVIVRYRQYHLVRPKVEERMPQQTKSERGKLRVFLCHSSGDKPAVRAICTRLREDGFQPWLDEEQLLPGQDWQLEIKKAVRSADAVVVCLSSSSVTKEGFLQREFRGILDVAGEKPEGAIFVIPVKLEKCDVPDRLERLHYVELFENDGYNRLKLALETRAASIRT